MPDAHVGIGATVGSVIPTKGAVIPAAVGVDIGCGMIAAELDVTEDQLPDTLEPLLGRIERADPRRRRPGPRRGRHATPTAGSPTHRPATELADDQADKAAKQFGTLGSGNHFFELCVDERGRVWVVLHSGSRGIGNQLAQMHIAKARTPGQGRSSCGSRTRTWRTSSRARRSSRPTSPTCCGPRTTPGPTATR